MYYVYFVAIEINIYCAVILVKIDVFRSSFDNRMNG